MENIMDIFLPFIYQNKQEEKFETVFLYIEEDFIPQENIIEKEDERVAIIEL